jgi:multiple sugar transport system substrate-binding protein
MGDAWSTPSRAGGHEATKRKAMYENGSTDRTEGAPRGASRRRLLAGSLAGVTAVGALTACNRGPATESSGPRTLSKESLTLTWATPGNQQEQEVYGKVAETFTQTYPNITVNRDAPAADLTKLVSLITSDSAPEIMFATINNWPSLAVQNVWLALDDLIRRDRFDLQDFFPQIVKPYRYDGKRFGDGKLYGLAKEIAVRAMYYNADHFQDSGVTAPAPDTAWTWDQFRTAARQVTKRSGDTVERYGYAMETWWGMWAIWAWANGGEVVDDPWAPTKATMDTPAVIEALEFWGGLVAREKVAPPLSAYSTLGKSDHFAQGRASMYNNGRWMVPLFRRSTFNWDVMLMPRNKQRAQLLTGSIFGVSRATRWPDESWELLKFINSKESQALMTELGLLFPSRQSVARSDTFLKSTPPAHSELFLKDVEVARVLPMHPRYPEMERAVGTESDAVLNGAKSAAAAAKEMTTQVNLLLTS